MNRTKRKPVKEPKKSTRKLDPVLELKRLTIKQLNAQGWEYPPCSGCYC